MTRWLTVLAVAIGVLAALLLLPRLVDLRMNRVRHKPPYAAPQTKDPSASASQMRAYGASIV